MRCVVSWWRNMLADVHAIVADWRDLARELAEYRAEHRNAVERARARHPEL